MAKRRPSGDGMVRLKKENQWEGRIVVGHKQNGDSIFRYAYGKTQKEMMQKLSALKLQYQDADPNEDSNITLSEWLDKWIKELMPETVRPTTLKGFELICRCYIKPYLGDKKIAFITTNDVQKMYAKLKKEGRIVIGYDENGLPKTKNVTAKTKTECIEKLEKLKNETGFIRREKVHSRMTFGEWMDFWYKNYCKIRIKESTQEGYETRIYNHIIPKIGKIPLNELTQNDLQKFYNSLKQDGRLRYRDTLGEGLSDRFVRSCHANCRTALQKATDDRLIKKNPAIGCKIPLKKSREMQVLTPDEIKRFLIQAKYDGFFEIFIVALSTGMRRGEDMALKWEDLDFDTGELKVRRQVKRTKGRLVITEPKTEESVRTIILPKSLVSILKEYKETIDSEWTFPSPRVEEMPRDPSAVYGMMQVILERAECKKFRFHDLRHTFATTSVANGMDIKTLSTILGHVSSKTTLDIYLHSTEEMKKEAAEKINARFNKDTDGNEETITEEQEKLPQAKFEPKKGKMRKPGTGCISKINDHLYEGRYSPKDAYGKRMARNIYAPTREECEEKLAILIKEMKAEIAEQKAKLKNAK